MLHLEDELEFTDYISYVLHKYSSIRKLWSGKL